MNRNKLRTRKPAVRAQGEGKRQELLSARTTMPRHRRANTTQAQQQNSACTDKVYNAG